MQQDPGYIAQLLLRRLEAPLSEQEEALLQETLHSSGDYPSSATELLNEDVLLKWYADEQRWKEDQLKEKILGRVRHAIAAGQLPETQVPQRRIVTIRRWWVAASVILLLAGSVYFWLSPPSRPSQQSQTAQLQPDVQPGKDGAILTLADGTQIVLDSLGDGVIATQNGSQVRLQNGQLAYDPAGNTIEKMEYNTMSTPKGRQFNMVLPDGTRVWLNSASSIRYPTLFLGSERRVEITGEAYFEVQKKSVPFIVNADNRAEIEVLGTHFNINSYSNESSLNTTLLEGSVRVVRGKENVVIRPGEQAQIGKTIRIEKEVDLNQTVAWKNGQFNFDDLTLQEVMRQLERWYDIEVLYEKGVPEYVMGGEMTKGIPLNGLLIGLKKVGVHYRLEGRILIITP